MSRLARTRRLGFASNAAWRVAKIGGRTRLISSRQQVEPIVIGRLWSSPVSLIERCRQFHKPSPERTSVTKPALPSPLPRRARVCGLSLLETISDPAQEIVFGRRTLPRGGCSEPVMTPSRWLFPEAAGPTTANDCPAATVSDTVAPEGFRETCSSVRISAIRFREGPAALLGSA